MQAEKRQCAKGIWKSGSYRESQCSKPGTLEHEGWWYCKTHHPPSKEARAAVKPKCAVPSCTTTVRDTKYCGFHAYDQITRDELVELRKDKARLDWLGKNDVIQQEVGSHGWTLPERTFREAIDAMEETNAK